jgi:putative heme-binding domain-containing protein
VERRNVFTGEHRAERERIVQAFAKVTQLRGDTAAGREVFKQQCAQCHRSHGEGVEVGPDLSIMTGKPVQQVVEAILNPNLAIDARYQAFTVVTADDEFTGVIATETPNSVTLRVANRAEQTLLRSDMKEFSTSGLSLMPEGFEALTAQQLADVAAFILGK